MTRAAELTRAGKVVLDALDLAIEQAERMRAALKGLEREITTLQVLYEATVQAGEKAVLEDAAQRCADHDIYAPVLGDEVAAARYAATLEQDHA